MENIIANVTQIDNDVRAERCIGGMKEAASEGRYVWTAPIGYTNGKLSGKSNIIPCPIMAPIIKETFERVANCNGNFEEIRKAMTSIGLVNNSGKPISKSYFYTFLRNKTYCGLIMKFGKVNRGHFEPIITEELLNTVQWKLSNRSERYFQYNKYNPDFPLRRFVYHPSGMKLKGSWSKGKRQKFPYFRFMSQGHNYSKEFIERKFVQFLNLFRLNEHILNYFRKKIDENYHKKSEVERLTDQNNQKKLEELNQEIRSMLIKHEKGLISDEILKLQMNRLNEELINTKNSLN